MRVAQTTERVALVHCFFVVLHLLSGLCFDLFLLLLSLTWISSLTLDPRSSHFVPTVDMTSGSDSSLDSDYISDLLGMEIDTDEDDNAFLFLFTRGTEMRKK